MSTLLQITSSITGDNSNSTSVSNAFIERWKSLNPDGRVVVRDLAAQPVPHLDGARMQALFTPQEQRTAEQQAVVDYSDTLIDELRNADVIVLGVPLYNFGMPSTLKAYFDHIGRAGVTFRYTSEGPEGLLPNVPLYVFAARGGIYAETPVDWQLSTFLGFIGYQQVEYIYVEGVNLGDEKKAQALTQAREKIEQLLTAA